MGFGNLGLIAAIYKEAGKQEMHLKQRPEELKKLVEIAKVQSTEASNTIECALHKLVTSCEIKNRMFGKEHLLLHVKIIPLKR